MRIGGVDEKRTVKNATKGRRETSGTRAKRGLPRRRILVAREVGLSAGTETVRLVPWISFLTALLVVVSPLGQEVIHGLSSGEQLSRSLSQLLLMIGLGGLALLTLIELAVRIYFTRRAARAE